MKVRFNRGALRDIGEILDYISEWNPPAASNLSLRFEHSARLLAAMPEIGAQTVQAQFRRLVVDNYIMAYEITGGEVIIHYVRHGARKQPWEEE